MNQFILDAVGDLSIFDIFLSSFVLFTLITAGLLVEECGKFKSFCIGFIITVFVTSAILYNRDIALAEHLKKADVDVLQLDEVSRVTAKDIGYFLSKTSSSTNFVKIEDMRPRKVPVYDKLESSGEVINTNTIYFLSPKDVTSIMGHVSKTTNIYLAHFNLYLDRVETDSYKVNQNTRDNLEQGIHDKSILIAVEDPNAQGTIVPVAYNSDNIPNKELLSQIKKLQSMLLKGDLPIQDRSVPFNEIPQSLIDASFKSVEEQTFEEITGVPVEDIKSIPIEVVNLTKDLTLDYINDNLNKEISVLTEDGYIKNILLDSSIRILPDTKSCIVYKYDKIIELHYTTPTEVPESQAGKDVSVDVKVTVK